MATGGAQGAEEATQARSAVVERWFVRDARDMLWVTDITEHPTREGKVYCAAALDTVRRRIGGRVIGAHPVAALVTARKRGR